MYNVVKVVDLVRHFCASCQRHGLCDEETFPQNFVSIINELERCGPIFSLFLSLVTAICLLTSLPFGFGKTASLCEWPKSYLNVEGGQNSNSSRGAWRATIWSERFRDATGR